MIVIKKKTIFLKQTISGIIRYKKTIFAALLGITFLAGGLWTFLSGTVSITTSNDIKKVPIYAVDTPEKKISLTFNAAWDDEQTKGILNTLKKHNVKTTFFVTGEWMEKYPESVKAIHADGHDLANHGENHKHMPLLSREEQKSEIEKVHQRMNKLLGIDMNLYRAPYGDYSNSDLEAADACNYQAIQWSVDSLDWKDYGKDQLVSTVLDNEATTNGAIVLLHVGAKHTEDALEPIITGIQEKGLEIVPVSALIHKEPFTIDHTGKQLKSNAQ